MASTLATEFPKLNVAASRCSGRAEAKESRSSGRTCMLSVDASKLLAVGKIERTRLRELFTSIEPELNRYRAVDAPEFKRRIERFLESNVPNRQ